MDAMSEILQLRVRVKLLETTVDGIHAIVKEMMAQDKEAYRELNVIINQIKDEERKLIEQTADNLGNKVKEIKDAIRQDVFNDVMAVIAQQPNGESEADDK